MAFCAVLVFIIRRALGAVLVFIIRRALGAVMVLAGMTVMALPHKMLDFHMQPYQGILIASVVLSVWGL